MIDQDKLTAASRVALAQGLRVLQGFRLENSDVHHMLALLFHMDPAPATAWLDIGCGFGEPARLLRELRPDLSFWLVNNNSYQLSQAPADMPQFCCDMHELPFGEDEFDGAMFLYSMCHADDVMTVLREAARVVKPGGKLFVYDYIRFDGDNAVTYEHLHARFFPFDNLRAAARAGGWRLDSFILPKGSDAVFRSLFASPEEYQDIMYGLRPIIWKATKR